mmetsp:Transcript_22095/g.44305  ORF Transcript_22095/g.44305 Transcript_22095/m.44305 type:complete len:352 (+) Transcript_22095:53-1108(+)
MAHCILGRRTVFVLVLIFTLIFVLAMKFNFGGSSQEQSPPVLGAMRDEGTVRIAFLGNSILYYNDCPRLIVNMFRAENYSVKQDSCLRGGATLSSLWDKGNGMAIKFATEPALLPPSPDDPDGPSLYDIGAATVSNLLGEERWDYIVMNDHTQGPARNATRNSAVRSLVDLYAPLIEESGAIPIFVQTWAYLNSSIKNAEDLGDTEEFTRRVRDGYRCYVQHLYDALPQDEGGGRVLPLIAPVGDVFLYLYQTDRDMWERLFYRDGFHPSPHGTYLEACVVYRTAMDEMPPRLLEDTWWLDARVMQPAGEEPMVLPTEEEAEVLWEAVRHVCEEAKENGNYRPSDNYCSDV